MPLQDLLGRIGPEIEDPEEGQRRMSCCSDSVRGPLLTTVARNVPAVLPRHPLSRPRLRQLPRSCAELGGCGHGLHHPPIAHDPVSHRPSPTATRLSAGSPGCEKALRLLRACRPSREPLLWSVTNLRAIQHLESRGGYYWRRY